MAARERAHEPGLLGRLGKRNAAESPHGDADVDVLALADADGEHAAFYLGGGCSGGGRSGGNGRVGFLRAKVFQNAGRERGERVTGLGQACAESLADGHAAVQIEKAGLAQLVENGGILKILRADDKPLLRAAAENGGVFGVVLCGFSGDGHGV